MPRGRSDNSKGVWCSSKAAMAPTDGVVDPGRCSVYSGLVLFDLMIIFWVERSFTDKPNVSNSIEH
jgi:hypothetical protein